MGSGDISVSVRNRRPVDRSALGRRTGTSSARGEGGTRRGRCARVARRLYTALVGRLSTPGSGAVARNDRAGVFGRRGLMVTLELAPGRQRARIDDAIEEELAVEVVDLVLVDARREPAGDELQRGTVAI